mmetsp:Transcript_6577/g.14870  ORF Transcript_6577/g.14870 Transcript_6577/m.14870 type:complete len:636 (+) Transcript_6577:202-2109(+)
MLLRNIVKAAMVLVMRMSCVIEGACAASSFPTSVMSHMSRNSPSNSLRNYTFGRKSALFCHNSKRCHIPQHAHLRLPPPCFQRSLTNNYTCEKQRLFIHPWRFHASDRHLPTSIISMHSQSTAEQQSSFSSESDGESETNIELDELSEMIKESYSSGETDGVQAALSSNSILAKLLVNLDTEEIADQLVGAAIDAAGKDRGRLAAMINSILASCCGSDDDDANTNLSMMHPQISLAILDHIDEMNSMEATSIVAPDIVSLSLVFYSLQQPHGTHTFESESQEVLERAQKIAKKAAGSQRRKALAAERRRTSNTNGVDAKQTESHLQSLYGPDIHILHETNDVIVIAKPAGMVCYHTKKTTSGKISRKKKSRAANTKNSESSSDGAKQRDISLVDALLDVSVSLSTVNPTARGIVHRLDRGTSGSIVLAKTDDAHLKLVALFFLRRAKKKYLAMVPGCNTANGVSEGESLDLDNEPLPFTVGTTGVIDFPVDGRPARSTYKVVKELGKQKQSSAPEALLLEVETLTGRKHQVRVHCASLGRPIFLDQLYSSSTIKPQRTKNEKEQKKKNSPSTENTVKSTPTLPPLPQAICDLLDNSNHTQEQFFLHAMSLSIQELGISANAPLPNWWADTTDQMD